jgi:urocanate hydratase
MAGNLMMSGLPFTVSDNVNRRGGIAYGVISGKTTATDVLGGYFVQGTTTLQFTKLNANNTNWAITDTTSSMQCQFSGWYYTDE